MSQFIIGTNGSQGTTILGAAQPSTVTVQGSPVLASASATPPATTRVTKTAGAALNGHRAIMPTADGRVIHADRTDPNADAVMGITLASAVVNGSVEVVTDGEISEPAWTWTPQQPIYLDTNGTLTQTVPTSGMQIRMGTALTPTTMLVAIEPALELA